jgi:hypothetical protein
VLSLESARSVYEATLFIGILNNLKAWLGYPIKRVVTEEVFKRA